MANVLQELLVKVGADISGLSDGLQDASGALDKFATDAERSFRGFDKLGSQLKSVGANLSAALTLPLAGIAAASVKMAADFEQSMNKVEALGEITGKSLKALEDQAIELGAKTKFSAKDAADGMAELAAAGFNAAQVTASIPAVLDLASAGALEVGRAAEIAAGLMGGFGIEAEGMGKAVDVIAKAAASGSQSVEDMATSFKYVGPVAKSAGLSLQEVSAALTVLAGAGLKGEQAGTSLRAMMASLLAPSTEVVAAMKALKLSVSDFQDASGKLKPLASIIDTLGKSGATTADIFKIFGRETASAVTALVSKGAPALRQLTTELENSEGAAKKMADTLNQGITGAFERAKGSIETTGIAIGKALSEQAQRAAGYVEGLANAASEAVAWFAKLPAPIQDAALGLAALAAAIGPVTIGFGLLFSSFSAIAGGIGTFVSLSGALTSAISNVVFAVNNDMVGALTSGEKALLNLGRAFAVAGAAAGLVFIGSELKDGVLSVVDSTKMLIASFLEVEEHGERVGDSFRNLKGASGETVKEVGLLETAARALAEEFAKTTPKTDGWVSFWENWLVPIGRAKQELERFATFYKAWVGQFASDKQTQAANSGVMGKGLQTQQDFSANNMRRQADDAMKLVVAQQAAAKAAESHGKALTGLGGALDTTGEKTKDAKVKILQFTEEMAKALNKTRELHEQTVLAQGAAGLFDIRLNMGDFDKDAADLDAVISKIIEKMQNLKYVSKEVEQVLGDAFKAGLKEADSLEAAMAGLGVKSAASLQKQLEGAQAYLKVIASRVNAEGEMIAHQNEYDQALKATLDIERQLAVVRGESTADIDARLKAVNERLGEHGTAVKGAAGAWGDFSKEVSTIITNFSQNVAKSLFDGTKDWGAKFTSIWKELKQAVVAHFITPVTEALTKFMVTTLADLLGGKGFGGVAQSIKGIGTAISGVFGGGAKAGADVAGAAGTAAAGVAKAGGGASSGVSAALGGLSGWVGAAGSIANAIVSGIGLARLEGTLNQIERNTAQISINIGNLIKEAQLHLPRLSEIKDAWYKYFEYFATLMATTEEIRDRQVDIVKAITDLGSSMADSQQPLAEAIASLPEEQRAFADVIVMGLDQLGDVFEAAIHEQTTALAAAIREGGSGGGSSMSGASLSGALTELQYKRQDILDKQNALLETMPAELAAALRSGGMPNPSNAAESAAVRQYNDLHDLAMALEAQINSFKGEHLYTTKPDESSTPKTSSYSGAVDPETGSLNPSKVKTTINATVIGGGGGMGGDVGALHEMINANFQTLFDILTNGEGVMKSSKQEIVDGVAQVAGKQDTLADAIEVNTQATVYASTGIIDSVTSLGADIVGVLAGTSANSAMGGVGAVFGSDNLNSLADSFEAAGYSDQDTLARLRDMGLNDVADALSAAGGSIEQAANALTASGINTVSQLQAAVMQSGAGAFVNLTSPATSGSSAFSPAVRTAGGSLTVNVGTIRGRDDVDYLVGRLGEFGVRY